MNIVWFHGVQVILKGKFHIEALALVASKLSSMLQLAVVEQHSIILTQLKGIKMKIYEFISIQVHFSMNRFLRLSQAVGSGSSGN